MRGLTIIYIGDGKGKTLAAVGLAIRAVGAGLKVLFLQFVKGGWISSEVKILKSLPGVEMKLLGKGFVGILGDKKPRQEHKAAAKKALIFAKKAISSGKYFLVILDEAISAVETKLIETADILKLIKEKPDKVHLCLTGHKRIKSLIDEADLVTEMKMIKHPYYSGILGQKGIDF